MSGKKNTILATAIIILVIIAAAALMASSEPIRTSTAISGTQQLVLDEQDIQQLGLTSDVSAEDLQQLGLGDGTNCHTEADYSNIVDQSLGQYSICIYNIDSLNNTQVIIELQKFANYDALNGTYQYDSLHLYSVEGLISENDFGDQSRFRVNNENDYGGQFNPPGIYFYHLWFTEDLYLVHITSKGSEDAKDYIANIGQLILSKFG